MVISGSSLQAEFLESIGVPRDKLSVVIPGADPDRFLPHRRCNRAIGFCSAYYPRKRPDVVLGLVHTLRHRTFRMLGRGWRDAPEFSELAAAPNFTYHEASYDAYPRFYDEIDVFVSPSQLEGGPIPLLEAMMADVVPVATRTGFAPDLVRHAENGFLCEVDATVPVFAELVEQAIELDPSVDVRGSVVEHTWDRFANTVISLTA
jgi:glycosyltransferase involved in cell wall biosynthesis